MGILDDPHQNDDEVAYAQFKETAKFIPAEDPSKGGRYSVSFPVKDPCYEVARTFQMAMKRLQAVLKKLGKSKKDMKDYDDYMLKQIEMGVVEDFDNSVPARGKINYLPHQAVYKPGSTSTKLRVVFDGSAKTKGDPSVNECLLRGPVILPELVGVAMRCRMHPIITSSDIEKAFLQVGLNPEDKDLTRFLWVYDTSKPASGTNIRYLRFTRVPFGIISSPFLLSGTIVLHLSKYPKEIADKILRNIYVDNVFCGHDTVKEAYKFYLDSKKILQEASMNLREWVSNSAELMEMIPEVDRGQGDLGKILGLKWDLKEGHSPHSGAHLVSQKLDAEADDNSRCSVLRPPRSCLPGPASAQEADSRGLDPQAQMGRSHASEPHSAVDCNLGRS